MKNSITFCVFSDLHYKYGTYTASVEDLLAILKRAGDGRVDFVIHCGDLCNDFTGSPELYNAYLNNSFDLRVYGIYGNHDLEASGNSMEFVTPKLTNDPNAVWGTENGQIGNGQIGYYYFDFNGFRIICADTNYSYCEQSMTWEHNRTGSHTSPKGNIGTHSLGDKQLVWLENTLWDAKKNDLRCIVFSHAAFSGYWESSPDCEKVRKLFKEVNEKGKNTVIAAINGHTHKPNTVIIEGVLYFDAGSAINGEWIENGYEHYPEEMTYIRSEYDAEGKLVERKEVPLSEARMSRNSWYFEKPLSAIFTVETNGHIVINGMKTKWVYGIFPDNKKLKPEIVDDEFYLSGDGE